MANNIVDEIMLSVEPTQYDETLVDILNIAFDKMDCKLTVPYSAICKAETIYHLQNEKGRYNVGIFG